MLPSPRRSMLGIILLLSVRPVLGGAQTPSGAMPVTANVMVSTECRYGSDLNGSRAEAAGILIGRVADSVFAVTALHVVRPSDPTCSAREVVLVLREPFAYFRVDVVRQSERDDLALLRGAPDSLDALLRGRHWNRRGPEPRGTVFLLGCPVGGSCWDDPLEGRIRSQSVLRDSSVWRIQSPFLEDGYSGGPVVSRSGEVGGWLDPELRRPERPRCPMVPGRGVAKGWWVQGHPAHEGPYSGRMAKPNPKWQTATFARDSRGCPPNASSKCRWGATHAKRRRQVRGRGDRSSGSNI